MDGSAAQLNLNWVDVSGGADGFSIERSTGLDDPFTIIGTTAAGVTAYADTSLADSATYCYRVRAFNATAYSTYSYPACGTTSPAGHTLSLTVNRDSFEQGDYFQLDVSFAQRGSSALVDVYLGSVLPAASDSSGDCPEGDSVAYVVDAAAGLGGLVGVCLADESSSGLRLYSGLPADMLPGLMGTDFFSFDWPLTTPGDYTIFMTVTRAGTADVIAQGTVTVSYFP